MNNPRRATDPKVGGTYQWQSSLADVGWVIVCGWVASTRPRTSTQTSPSAPFPKQIYAWRRIENMDTVCTVTIISLEPGSSKNNAADLVVQKRAYVLYYSRGICIPVFQTNTPNRPYTWGGMAGAGHRTVPVKGEDKNRQLWAQP